MYAIDVSFDFTAFTVLILAQMEERGTVIGSVRCLPSSLGRVFDSHR
jgi:hypothetical protein